MIKKSAFGLLGIMILAAGLYAADGNKLANQNGDPTGVLGGASTLVGSVKITTNTEAVGAIGYKTRKVRLTNDGVLLVQSGTNLSTIAITLSLDTGTIVNQVYAGTYGYITANATPTAVSNPNVLGVASPQQQIWLHNGYINIPAGAANERLELFDSRGSTLTALGAIAKWVVTASSGMQGVTPLGTTFIPIPYDMYFSSGLTIKKQGSTVVWGLNWEVSDKEGEFVP